MNKCIPLLLCFFVSAGIWAAPEENKNIPDTVYRVDKRHYSEVFKNGFKSWSTMQENGNANIADHVSGRSCTMSSTSNRNTIFISVSANRNFVETLARNKVNTLRTGEFITIYTIHPDINMFESFRSLVWLQDNEYATVSPSEFAMAVAQREWVAVHSIDPSTIERATTYFRDGNRIRIEEHINPYYIYSIDRVVNTAPFSQFHPQRPQRGNWRVWIQNNLPPMVSQCFTSAHENTTDVYIQQKNTQPEYSANMDLVVFH